MNTNKTTRMRQVSSRCCMLALIALFILLPVAGIAGAAGNATVALPVQAELLAQTRLNPQAPVSVIVQERWASDAPEQRVAELGGDVVAQLDLIGGFSAVLPAEAVTHLAAVRAVRWISLDAPMQSAQSEQTAEEPRPAFVTWATASEKLEGGNLAKHANATDSAWGPAGTYAVANKGKTGFRGFEAEVSDGHRIAKVEAVIAGYVDQPINQPVLISAYIDGVKAGEAVIGGGALSGSSVEGGFSADDPGMVYVDVTGSRQWLWGDFAHNVQVVLDFSNLGKQEQVYIDSVGLRVWIAPGVDESGAEMPPATDITKLPNPQRQVNVYNKVIGVESIWDANPQLQGSGVGVAVVDSGVAKTGDLAHLSTVNVNFNRGFHDSMDRYGHGTFVTSIAAGSGAASHGIHVGVAPRVRLINVRVSDDVGMATTTDVLLGLQWILANQAKYNIRVVNLSLNSSVAASYLNDPLCAAVELLWLRGIVVVVSAGNNGTSTLYPPANDPFVLTVGATDDAGTATTDDDTVAAFSGYGVTELGQPKPDLVAPGRNIIGYLPTNGILSMPQDHSDHRINDSYFRMSGTSVSAPMVTGAVALLLQDEPGLSPDQVKYRLTSTANKNWPGYNAERAGSGYVDVYAAVNGSSLEAANVGFPISQLLWAGLAEAQWEGVDWSSVNWNSVNWNSVNWNSVNWNSVNWNSVNWNSVNWNSVNWNSVNWNSDYWEEPDAGLSSSSAASIPAVNKLMQLLAEDEAEAEAEVENGAADEAAGLPDVLYLPMITR